jgi:hypothetical protein
MAAISNNRISGSEGTGGTIMSDKQSIWQTCPFTTSDCIHRQPEPGETLSCAPPEWGVLWKMTNFAITEGVA